MPDNTTNPPSAPVAKRPAPLSIHDLIQQTKDAIEKSNRDFRAKSERERRNLVDRLVNAIAI